MHGRASPRLSICIRPILHLGWRVILHPHPPPSFWPSPCHRVCSPIIPPSIHPDHLIVSPLRAPPSLPPFHLSIFQTLAPPTPLRGCCCCCCRYATPLPSVSMWTLRNAPYSCRILMSSRAEATKGHSTSRSGEGNSRQCFKGEVKDGGVVHQTVSSAQCAPPIGAAAAARWLRQGQPTGPMSLNPNLFHMHGTRYRVVQL